MSPLAVNEIFQRSTFDDLTCLGHITVDQSSMLTCTFIRFTHFRFSQMKLENINYSLDRLGSDSVFIMSGYLH